MSGTQKPQDAAAVEQQRAEERAKSEAEAAKANVSTTVEGGRFLTAQGVLVNANGEEIDDNGKVKK